MESQLNQLAFEPVLSDPEGTGGRANESARRAPAAGCDSTLSIDDAAGIAWDAAVIGAGPTGALAARELARRGLRTLLLDRSTFPREKVCGGCVSGLGRQLLESVGLESLLAPPVAVPLTRFELAATGRRVAFALPAGAVVSRYEFDAALVRHAVQAGVAFCSGTTTLVRGLSDGCRFRRLVLQHDDHPLVARARFVIVADGLGRSSLKRHRAFAPRVAASSRIGLGATLPATAVDLEPGCVSMSVGRDGYVGMVRLPGDVINLAAAVDPQLVRQLGPAHAVRTVLSQAGTQPPSDLENTDWRGTGLLTRQSPRSSARRLLVLGDAAGYVEPFTGEGMTWGLMSAVLAAPLVADWLTRDDASVVDQRAARRDAQQLGRTWSKVSRTQLVPRQRDCRILSNLLRRPAAVRAAMALLAVAPGVARPFIAHYWNSGRKLAAAAQFSTRSFSTNQFSADQFAARSPMEHTLR
jgi:flavin-dependent dehydrogenase